ncbi:MAG: helix-turn-helix transcriptional regulator [Flavobacteriales bacterium]|nr:helix-turn-helix transcriptional regulator [Flavobacteriales bacterium]
MINLSNGTDMLADELRKQRVIRGYSQEYMAECLGISQRQYSRLENSKCEITVSRLSALCKVLAIPVSHFLSLPE